MTLHTHNIVTAHNNTNMVYIAKVSWSIWVWTPVYFSFQSHRPNFPALW